MVSTHSQTSINGDTEAKPASTMNNGHGHGHDGHPSYLTQDISTESTPNNFISPPDKPEYHPYRFTSSGEQGKGKDWQDDLELETATALCKAQSSPLRFLVV
jgi:hypothetical protein